MVYILFVYSIYRYVNDRRSRKTTLSMRKSNIIFAFILSCAIPEFYGSTENESANNRSLMCTCIFFFIQVDERLLCSDYHRPRVSTVDAHALSVRNTAIMVKVQMRGAFAFNIKRV